MTAAIPKQFDPKEWRVCHEIVEYEVNIAIVREAVDGGRDVMMKDGTVAHVPPGRLINNICGPTLVLKEVP